MKRKSIQRHYYFRLFLISVAVAVFSCFLAFTLKIITEYFEEQIFEFAHSKFHWSLIFLPSIGITIIYFLRKYLFKNRQNKGIAEIYKTVDKRKNHLPFFKIPSHYLNGFFTVIFGGSTGVEVSTVVATATIGNALYKKNFSANIYKLELICAGVCAGVSILFGSPVVGFLFAFECIARKRSKTLFISILSSALVSWLFLYFFPSKTFIPVYIKDWHWFAIPFMLVLSLLCGLLSAGFTVIVIRIKSFFSNIENNFIRVNLGALIVGLIICFLPFLYGDSYHSLIEVCRNPQSVSILLLVALFLLKPIASALTLGSGGDGGVFAPSIVAGAYLGICFAMLCNHFFGTSLLYLNFALIGAAATLSTSIYAPLTAVFLVSNLVPNGFILFIPLLLTSYLSKIIIKKFVLPYNVYTYLS